VSTRGNTCQGKGLTEPRMSPHGKGEQDDAPVEEEVGHIFESVLDREDPLDGVTPLGLCFWGRCFTDEGPDVVEVLELNDCEHHVGDSADHPVEGAEDDWERSRVTVVVPEGKERHYSCRPGPVSQSGCLVNGTGTNQGIRPMLANDRPSAAEQRRGHQASPGQGRRWLFGANRRPRRRLVHVLVMRRTMPAGVLASPSHNVSRDPHGWSEDDLTS
jgi:hypothetical protein